MHSARGDLELPPKRLQVIYGTVTESASGGYGKVLPVFFIVLLRSLPLVYNDVAQCTNAGRTGAP